MKRETCGTGGTGERSETGGATDGSRFSELRTLNVELWIAPFSSVSPVTLGSLRYPKGDDFIIRTGLIPPTVRYQALVHWNLLVVYA